MKTITNPTESKPAKRFKKIIDLLVQEFNPLQVYRFAQLRKKAKQQSVFAQKKEEDQWAYYLFVVTEANSSALSIQKYMDEHCVADRVFVLVEAQENLLRGHHNCNGYYASIIHNGLLCYSSTDVGIYGMLKQPNVRKFLGRAVLHWRNRLKMAQGFLEAGEQALEAGHEQVCLFLLYQASEQLCKGLIYVFMGYQEQNGNLKRLLNISACFSSLPLQYFMGTPDNETLLDIMCKSIALGNGKDNELPADKSIYRFLELVESFLKLTEKLSTDRLAELQLEVDKVKELKADVCALT